MKSERYIFALLFIMIGAVLQNVMWYFRLKSPLLMREFVLNFDRDGAMVFLDYNMMTYPFLLMVLILYIITWYGKKSSEKTSEANT